MAKLQISCVTCGFFGFVDSLVQADESGWKAAPSGVGGELECPACRIDAARGIKPLTRVAGRTGIARGSSES